MGPSNVDERALRFRERLVNLENEKRTLSEDIRDLVTEMKSAGLTPVEIAGVKLAAKRALEEDAKRQKRESIEEFAASLGEFADLPLGAAAVAARS
jgi:uncharacterized protein (UPF0335 family)